MHVSAQRCDHADHGAEWGWSLWQRLFLNDQVDGLPFRWFKHDFTTEIGAHPSESAQGRHTPSDNQIDGNGVEFTIQALKLAFLDATAGLQGFEKDLDVPSGSVTFDGRANQVIRGDGQ